MGASGSGELGGDTTVEGGRGVGDGSSLGAKVGHLATGGVMGSCLGGGVDGLCLGGGDLAHTGVVFLGSSSLLSSLLLESLSWVAGGWGGWAALGVALLVGASSSSSYGHMSWSPTGTVVTGLVFVERPG